MNLLLKSIKPLFSYIIIIRIQTFVILLDSFSIPLSKKYFSFSHKFYKQESGLSMRNPLFPFLVNLFMSFLETQLIKAFPYM